MFAFEKLHHVAIPAHDFARLQAFYVEVLGLQAHPRKSNWLRAGDGFSVHLISSTTPPGVPRVEQHFALQVDSLHGLFAHLLEHDLTPWQASLDGQVHDVRDPADPLDFGLGSLFITDPENKVIEFITGRDAILAFLRRKWDREFDYRLIKEVWAHEGNRIAVRFAYEWHDDSGHWFRSYGNENWEFNEAGLMHRRVASINDLPIDPSDRQFHWPLGPRPDGHPGLSELGL